MALIARDYQTECVNALWKYFASNKGNPLCALPTGTGKSLCIALFLLSIYKRFAGQKVIVLTHVQELIEQNYSKLHEIWPSAPTGIYSAGLGKAEARMPITFGGIASVAKKAHEFGHVDLIIIDEAHLVSPNDSTMYQMFINFLRAMNPKLKVIGFTATAWRLGHGMLTEPFVKTDKAGNETIIAPLFTDICFDITDVASFNRLIAECYLSPLVPKRTKVEVNLDGVHMRGGDFIEKELQQALNRDDITRRALQEALEYQDSRHKWLIFTAGVEHSIDTADILTDMGIRCRAVHSKIGKEERKEILYEFKHGDLQAVSNNNVLTTGFDHPAIDLIICLRPTQSSVLWVQMLGRGTRPYFNNHIGHNGGPPLHDITTFEGRKAAIADGGKRNCLVLDFAGNSKRLGPINDPVIPRKKGAGTGEAPVKQCEKCDTWVHASARVCNTEKENEPGVFCDYEFVFETKLKQAASTDELIRGSFPVVEVFKIDHITHATHTKQGKPPMMKVIYYCGLKMFTDYVCVQHEDYALRNAKKWWKSRNEYLRLKGKPEIAMPKTTEEALLVSGGLPAPTHLRVWTNKEWPEIMAYDFTATAFNTEKPSDYDEPPKVTVEPPRHALATNFGARAPLDEDIPF